SPTKPDKDLSHTRRPSAPIIEDWVSDSKDDSEAELPYNAPSFVQPTEQVKPPRPSVKSVETSILDAYHETTIPKPKIHGNSRNKKACFVYQDQPNIVTKPHSPPRRNINHSPSSKVSTFPSKVNAAKAPMLNVVKGVQGNWDKGVIDSGCSRHITGNMSYLSDFEELNGGYVAFCNNPKGDKISGKEQCFFTDTECLVLSPEFKLPDENQVLLRVPRKNNMYNVDLKNIVPSGDLTCLFVKATLDESNLWHRRLGHINFKTMNKLVKSNLVRGLPSKFLKIITHVLLVRRARNIEPLVRPSLSVLSANPYKDDYSRITWVFFLAAKDETSPILKTFITSIVNQLSLKVKIIRSDNRTKFKNNDLNQFCGMKGIKREFSVPRTPQQNGIAERKNMTLIKAARTMLADSLLPISF
nr:hypothetical protein [Tanacetum cinerariifolium]